MSSLKSFAWILSLMAAVVISNPALPQEASHKTETSITENDGVQRWRTRTMTSDFNIEVRGKIELTDDDKDIKSISDDGYLEINKTVFGSKRTIVIESLGGGKLKKEYYEGRTKMDWEKNGKEWLAEVLPELVRSSTIGAESRVNRFFSKGGATAVLNEIGEMESDYVQSYYGKLLLEKKIPSSDIPKVINTLADEISSDYYLSSMLKDSMPKLLVNKESGDAFFRATERIGSDYYKSVVLKEALKKYSASPDQVRMILNSASTINSAYYLSVVLTTLLEETDVKDESLADLVNVSKNVSSDYYRTEVLRKALKKPGLSRTALKNVLGALADVGSDYYKTNVFNDMAERTTIEPELQLQVINLLSNSVSSAYYSSVTLRKLLEYQKLSDESFQQLANVAGDLSSTSYAAEVLKEAADKDLTNSQVLMVIKAAAKLDSDHYLAEVLQSVAPRVRNGDQTLKEAYRQTAKNIDSEHYYGSALRAID